MPAPPTAADRARFDGIFERHERAVLAYAMRRTASAADAEDVAAETFLVAWRRLADVPADPLPWLYAVARRVLANQRRAAGRRQGLVSRLRERLERHVPDRPADDHAIAALEQLRDDDQELLRLVAWEGLSHSEIATVLGITANAVAIRLHRARQRFAAVFAEGSAADLKDSADSRTQAPVTGRTARSWMNGSTR